MQIQLHNSNILIKALKREEKDSIGATGVYIPIEDLEDEQVSQGVVVQDAEGFVKGDIVLFHKTLPIDINLILEGDTELTNYFFISFKDIICQIKS